MPALPKLEETECMNVTMKFWKAELRTEMKKLERIVPNRLLE
jgi:hypothetical protein